MEAVNSWLHASSIPRPLKQRIRAYYAGATRPPRYAQAPAASLLRLASPHNRAPYADVWLAHQAARANAVERFLELPHALRQEVAWEANRKLLQRLPLFRCGAPAGRSSRRRPPLLRASVSVHVIFLASLWPPWRSGLDDDQRFALSGMLQPLDLVPGQEFCLHGDPADRFYLLHEGEVQVGAGRAGRRVLRLTATGLSCTPPCSPVHALRPHIDSQLFDELDVVCTVAAPAVLGASALLQHAEPGLAVRKYGYRTFTAATLWEAPLEDLLPWLLEHPAALGAL